MSTAPHRGTIQLLQFLFRSKAPHDQAGGRVFGQNKNQPEPGSPEVFNLSKNYRAGKHAKTGERSNNRIAWQPSGAARAVNARQKIAQGREHTGKYVSILRDQSRLMECLHSPARLEQGENLSNSSSPSPPAAAPGKHAKTGERSNNRIAWQPSGAARAVNAKQKIAQGREHTGKYVSVLRDFLTPQLPP